MCTFTSSSSDMHRRNQLRRGHVAAAAAAAALLAIGLGAGFTWADTGTFIYAGCSPSKYQPGTPYEDNLKSLLTSITNAAPNAAYSSFANGTGDGAAAYGLYQCRGDLGNGECAACVRDALAQLGQVCPGAYAASLQLEGCYVRYDGTNFVGHPDTAMVYRKCSASTSADAGFLRDRDAVLGALQAAAADGYKVGSSGSVQGVSQCLGDLAAADCTACLAQAVGQLRGACGTALAADVHLAQCYVRYWASGYYFRPSQDDSVRESCYTYDEFLYDFCTTSTADVRWITRTSGITSYENRTHYSSYAQQFRSQDDVGRTLAIIIGILAGLALIVVFLSFLRKSC